MYTDVTTRVHTASSWPTLTAFVRTDRINIRNLNVPVDMQTQCQGIFYVRCYPAKF
jgi:hypothetical protein